MSAKPNGDGVAAVGVGVVTCAACCAVPILGFLGAIGLFTVFGLLRLGVAGLAIGAIGLAVLVHRRRRAATTRVAIPVPVEMPTIRTRP